MAQRNLTVILDLTSRCNLRCSMCYFSAVDRLRFRPFDREADGTGHLSAETFEKIAADLFPRAERVALACAAEPLIHPQFSSLATIAGRYQVPDLWFPTNLLALTRSKVEAIFDAGVAVVAASVDGFTQESYERIRVGGRWPMFLDRLRLLSDLKRERGIDRPRLRLIFTWMKSNRDQLRLLPEFAAEHGASEVDVRFVCPTAEVDNADELLQGEDPERLNAELSATAEDLVARGIRLASYPAFDTGAPGRSLLPRLQKRLWYWKAGLDGFAQRKHALREALHGCAYPGRTFVIRPNGAVFPCHFQSQEPIGFYPEGDLESFLDSPELTRLQRGLRTREPVGECRGCSQSRGLYRPLEPLVRLTSPFRRLGIS